MLTRKRGASITEKYLALFGTGASRVGRNSEQDMKIENIIFPLVVMAAAVALFLVLTFVFNAAFDAASCRMEYTDFLTRIRCG